VNTPTYADVIMGDSLGRNVENNMENGWSLVSVTVGMTAF
jgi:hypothetical protein